MGTCPLLLTIDYWQILRERKSFASDLLTQCWPDQTLMDILNPCSYRWLCLNSVCHQKTEEERGWERFLEQRELSRHGEKEKERGSGWKWSACSLHMPKRQRTLFYNFFALIYLLCALIRIATPVMAHQDQKQLEEERTYFKVPYNNCSFAHPQLYVMSSYRARTWRKELKFLGAVDHG